MATLREIRRRIKSVKNIAKVTGALEAVSRSKVYRAQAQALATRYYARAALRILNDVAQFRDSSITHPLLDERETIKNISIVLISSDRGLAGPYNTNVVALARKFELEKGVPAQYITIGRKGRDLVVRRGCNVVAEFSDLPATPSILDITAITRAAVDDFLNHVVDEVYIAYTSYNNMIVQDATIQRLLPLKPETSLKTGDGSAANTSASGLKPVYEFEPDPQSILDEIMPRFTELQLYQAVLESIASEHAARMVAMRNATENANAVVEDLTLSYNNARQMAITSEILDIVGGANALEQSQ